MTKRKYFFIVLMVTVLFYLLGVLNEPEKYTDVSHEKQYISVLGNKFVTKEELLAIGVTFDTNYLQKVDYVFFVTKPGISGPEVVFRNNLSKGAKFKIVGVLKSNSLFRDRIFYKIELIGSDEFKEHTSIIKLSNDVNSNNYGLYSEIYELIK